MFLDQYRALWWNCLLLSPTDIRSIPDVAMTGNCTNECSELGHSDACWMPGHPSPVRKTRNPPKLSTFVPYQERGSLGRLANGSARLGGEEHRSRLPPSRSAYSNSGHDASQDCPLEEMPLSVASEYPPTSPTVHTPKREIYLWGENHCPLCTNEEKIHTQWGRETGWLHTKSQHQFL